MSPIPYLPLVRDMGNCLNGGRQSKKASANSPHSADTLHAISTVYTGPTSGQNNVRTDPSDITLTEKDIKRSKHDLNSKSNGKSSKKINVDANGLLLTSDDTGTSKTSKVIQSSDADQKNVMGKLTSGKSQKYIAKFDHRVTAKYDIKALIGRGSYSRVVRVEHRLTRQPYAIKMVDKTKDGKVLAESELNVLRRVRHPCIIQLVEVFESREKLYMVVELATGGELFERVISVGHFNEREAVRILRMVLEGLRYLHSLGIAHRDLKPENLLFYHPGEDSKILITDFGLSAIRKASPMVNGSSVREGGIQGGGDNGSAGGSDESSSACDECCMRTTCGTPEYIAPEILARRPYTGQVDLWAVGVITYILLSGTMPFDDDSRSRLYRLILRAMYSYDGTLWKEVSALAKDFIDRLLVIDPSERLTAAEALAHPWITTPPPHTPPGSSASSVSTLRSSVKNSGSGSRHGRRAGRPLREKYASSSAHSSDKSRRSIRSDHSLRSERRRVAREEIDELHRDPELQIELNSLASKMSRSSARS